MAESIPRATNRRIQASKSGEKQRNLRQSRAASVEQQGNPRAGIWNRECERTVRNGESEKSRLARTWNPTLEEKKSGVWNLDRRVEMAPWWEILKIWGWWELGDIYNIISGCHEVVWLSCNTIIVLNMQSLFFFFFRDMNGHLKGKILKRNIVY